MIATTWQNPWAWAGLGLLALPVLVHLLSRAPAALRPFPSLRFIDASRLSPRRRTTPRDPLLLLVRLGILAAAVAALAGPGFARSAAGSGRMSRVRMARVIVLDTSASMRRPVVAGTGTVLDSARRVAAGMAADGDEREATTIVVATARPADAMAGALAWLKVQPGSHEIVLVSDFQRGAVDSAALLDMPRAYGLCLVRVRGAALDSDFTMPAAFPATSVRATTRGDATELRWASQRDSASAAVAVAAPTNRVTLRASDTERAALRVAVAATLGDAGIDTRVLLDSAPPSRDSMHAVEIVYPGFPGRAALLARATPPSAGWMSETVVQLAADPVLQELARTATETTAGTTTNARTSDSALAVIARASVGHAVVQAAQDTTGPGARLLLFTHADAGSALSAALIAAALNGVAPAPRLEDREPLALTDAELASWTRAASDTVAAEATSTDAGESQGRWLWALALLLLVVETLMRRASASAFAPAADETVAA